MNKAYDVYMCREKPKANDDCLTIENMLKLARKYAYRDVQVVSDAFPYPLGYARKISFSCSSGYDEPWINK